MGGITYERRQHYLQLVSSFLQVSLRSPED